MVSAPVDHHTWVLVAIDHFSRKVVANCALEGPNAGWVEDALEEAFLRYGPPRHIITDQEGVFAGEVFGVSPRETLSVGWMVGK